MATHKTPKNLAEQLRQAILDSGLTPYRVAKDSGAEYSALLRFMSGERGMNLESAGKVAALLGLELRPRHRKGKA